MTRGRGSSGAEVSVNRGGVTIFSKPKKRGQTPVRTNYTQMILKMGARSHKRCYIFASRHLCKSTRLL